MSVSYHFAPRAQRVLVGPNIAPFEHARQLIIGPCIKIHGFDSAYVRAHSSVYSRASKVESDVCAEHSILS